MKRFSRLYLTALILSGASSTMALAQTAQEFPLRAVAESKGPAPIEEVVYRPGSLDDRGFNRVVQKVAQPTLTLYRAARPGHRRAAVVLCPGGGYSFVVIDREGHMIARWLQEQGITAVVLKYRLPDPVADGEALPRPQQDALEAMRYVRGHAAVWDVDPARIGILGSSAGGHLAGSVGILGKSDDGSRPDFVTLLYPVIMMEGPQIHAGSRDCLLGPTPTPARLAEFSLERRVRPDLPPYFLVHAMDDKVVPPENSEAFATALKAQHVPVELLRVSRGGHGFSLGRDQESGRWKAAFLEWLDRLP